jgi:hypothetical protein
MHPLQSQSVGLVDIISESVHEEWRTQGNLGTSALNRRAREQAAHHKHTICTQASCNAEQVLYYLHAV